MKFRSSPVLDGPSAVLWVIAFILGIVGLVAVPSVADGGTIAKVKAYEISCTTTARNMAAVATAPDQTPGNTILFKNGATEIFIGGSDVTATTKGYPVAASAEKGMDVKPGSLYCITAAGSSTVEVFAGAF